VPEHAPKSEPVSPTSSTPPELPPEQEALFREVLVLMNELNVPYAVSGAFALRQHTGIYRFTKDLDIFLTAEDAPAALGRLAAQGYLCEVCDPVWLAKAHHEGFFVDLITGMSNGAIVVEQSWMQNARPAMVMGVETKVLAPEELIASKLFVTRRERFDGADIAHVIYGTRGELEWDRILQHVGEHWEILLWALLLFRYVYPAHSDYVPQSLWNELLSRLQRELSTPRLDAPFRGSLIDDNMFAIDVKEWGLENILEEYRRRREPKIHLPAA